MRRRKRGKRGGCGRVEEEVLSGSARSVSLKLNRVGLGGRDGERERVERASEGRGGGEGGANSWREKIRRC